MDSPRNSVVSIGLDRLFHEIVKGALSSYGWHVLDMEPRSSSENPVAGEAAGVEIVLVAGAGPVPAVISHLRHARERYPGAKIVLLGVGGQDADLVRFIEEGASGYVRSNEGMDNLVTTLQMLRSSRTQSSGRITQLVIRSIGRLSEDAHPAPEDRLTLREQEIFRLIQDGLSNKEIAGRLQIAPHTVKNHVHHLLEKLRVRNRHEAAWLRAKGPPTVAPEAQTGTGE
jgi:two-component system, NarL family, nitrate/nitrite response regulator NarL